MTLLIQDSESRIITSGALLTAGDLQLRGYLQRDNVTESVKDCRPQGKEAMWDLAKGLKRAFENEEERDGKRRRRGED